MGKAAEPELLIAPRLPKTPTLLTALYVAVNILASIGLVFANKLVLSKQYVGWNFVYGLTLLHTLMGWFGTFAKDVGAKRDRKLTLRESCPLAMAYVVYVVLNYESLMRNTVGFYQLSKICIAPCVLILEVALGKKTTVGVAFAVLMVCSGVGIATVTDPQVVSSPVGMWVGVSSIVATSTYQLVAAHYQKTREVKSSELLQSYSPIASCMLLTVSLLFEPWGLTEVLKGIPAPTTVLGFNYTGTAVAFIITSSVVGLAVNWSRLLVIGATSSLTYNILGQPLKTLIVLSAGYLFMGETVSLKKGAGVSLAMLGLLRYNHLVNLQPAHTSSS